MLRTAASPKGRADERSECERAFAAALFLKEVEALVFSTIIFLFRFLPITLALYYLAPAKLKNTVLFVCSLVFYCWGEVRFFPVMLALILINYLCGLGLEAMDA